MNRRVLYLSILLATLAIIVVRAQGSDASQGGNTGRVRTVEIQVLQYVWELVSNRDGRVICEVIVEHPNRPSNQEAITICGEQIFPAEPTPTPFVTATPGEGETPVAPAPTQETLPFDLAEFFQNVSWRFVTTREFTRTIEVPVPNMVLNMIVPKIPTEEYYVSIYAYEPIYGESIVEIRGFRNGVAFYCPSARCDLPITGDTSVEFWAVSSYGDESQHSMATFRVVTTDQGQRIELVSLVPIILFQDACAAIWGQPVFQMPEWAELPPLPDDLNTMKPYQFLAGKLITNGVVSAPDCPGGGLRADGAPNSCGLQQAGSAVVEWQNQFDLTIWNAGRDIGVPPILLKTVIEQESQFWPGNAIRAWYEYGLAQMNQSGADVALRWDNDLFNSICNGLLFDCSIMYGRLPSWTQAMLRGGLMRALDAECPTCAYGIDMNRAHETIPIIAQTLRANCRQVKFIADRRRASLNYEDLWRLTLISYHSGYQCVTQALDYTLYNELPATWQYISGFTCPGSNFYINSIWKSLEEFDFSRIKRPESPRPVFLPTFRATMTPVPTITPTVTPTPIRSLGSIRVLVYVDANANFYPEANERVDDVTVGPLPRMARS
jgi:hypothetical protein